MAHLPLLIKSDALIHSAFSKRLSDTRSISTYPYVPGALSKYRVPITFNLRAFIHSTTVVVNNQNGILGRIHQIKQTVQFLTVLVET